MIPTRAEFECIFLAIELVEAIFQNINFEYRKYSQYLIRRCEFIVKLRSSHVRASAYQAVYKL